MRSLIYRHVFLIENYMPVYEIAINTNHTTPFICIRSPTLNTEIVNLRAHLAQQPAANTAATLQYSIAMSIVL